MKRSSGSLTRSSRRNLCSHVVNALCSDKPLHWWSRSAPHFDCGVGRQTSFPPACFRQHRRAGCQPDGRALAHGTQSATGCCAHPVIASNSATNAREPTPGSSHMSRRWRGASISRGERRSGASVALRAATARSLAPRRTAGTLGGRPAVSFGVSGVGLAVARHKSAKRRMLACADGVERRCRRRVLNPPPREMTCSFAVRLFQTRLRTVVCRSAVGNHRLHGLPSLSRAAHELRGARARAWASRRRCSSSPRP